MRRPPYAVFLNGGYGVGKSSTLEHLGDIFASHGLPFSLMDVDWFHRSWPLAPDDPSNVLIEASNMAAVWNNYRTVGPRQLFLCGVLRDHLDIDRYTRALEIPVRSVRLVASSNVVEGRLRGRYGDGRMVALQWHLDRYLELAEELEATNLDELVISNDKLGPRDVAIKIVEHFGLLSNP